MIARQEFISAYRLLAGTLFAVLASSVSAQSTGNYATGQAYYDANCAGCHTLKKNRDEIAARAPSGLNFGKAINALNSVIANGVDLDGNAAVAMQAYVTLPTDLRGDIAAYISNLPTPSPVFTVDNPFRQLGPVDVGSTPASLKLNITNTGTGDLVFGANGVASLATGSDAADFSADGNDCAMRTLKVGTNDTCFVRVQFAPKPGASATRYAALGITGNTSPATTPIVKLVQLTGVISGNPSGGASAPPPTSAPTGSANAPSTGGGGSLPVTLLGLLFFALVSRRRQSAGSIDFVRPHCLPGLEFYRVPPIRG